MSAQNGTTTQADSHHTLEDQLDAIRAGVRKLIERVTAKPTAEPSAPPTAGPSRLRGLAMKASETIKSHPIAAVGVALGLGYVVVRLVRR